MQLDGLATGMDTTSIINQLVQLERRPIYNYEQEISEMELTKSAWRDVNSRLDKLEDRTTALNSSSTFNSNSATSSNSDVVTATADSNASTGDYQVDINSVAQTHRLGATTKISDINNTLSNQLGTAVDGDISVNGINIKVNTDETLSSLKTKINDANAGVAATIIDGNLVLESDETGVANEITLTNNANNLLDNLGLNGDLSDINNDSVLQVAQNAEVEINGITGITSSTNTFSDAVEGVTFNINPETELGSTATISVTKDTEKATDAIQAFVDQYNSAMNFLDGKTDYDAEEEKGSVLQGDGTAMRLQTRLRSLVTSQVKDTGDFKTLSSVGIEIDRYGVMSFDKTKFTEALEQSPEGVMSIFNSESATDGFDGMSVRMDSYLDQLMQTNTGLIPRRLDFYDTRIDSLNDDIEDVERKVEMTRERYTEQFAAMETAISEMNQQMSWMQSQLSSLAGSNSILSGTG